jgi:trans-AT polyketide synthase/acyltransferase/oxidoreductase domain-containing protein
LNLLHNPSDPAIEEKTVDLLLKYGVRVIEASAYMGITPSLVRYRSNGLRRDAGRVIAGNRIIAKISRPEVAEAFLSPAPARITGKLVEERKITSEQAELLQEIPMADDICVEADSGGHTDGGVAYALMPAMIRLRDDLMRKYGYTRKVKIGAAGGIGTPEAAAAAFVLGADFILTGSINQCTVEAGISDAAKDMLQQMNVQDTDYAPAGDMFEMGAKVQVLKKGVFFPARANKLYDLYRQHNSLDEIDEKTKKQIQEKYFKRSFEEIYKDAKSYYPPAEIEKAERNPKQKMAFVFRWYFGHCTRIALNGTPGHEVDYLINCGPALGAFNQWVKGTSLESWKKRKVDEIGMKLMHETANVLNERFEKLSMS